MKDFIDKNGCTFSFYLVTELGQDFSYYHDVDEGYYKQCASCNHWMPIDSFAPEDDTCYACYRDLFIKNKLNKLTLPETKQYARLLANKRYPTPHVCSVPSCGKTGDRHHPNYDNPTEIIWLCPRHHAELHAKLRGNLFGRNTK